MIERVPRAPGVYYLLGDGGRLLYVGKASDLRRRLASHTRSSRWRLIADVRYETTPSPSAALAREADVLAALRPPWNKAHVDTYFSFVRLSSKGLILARDGDYGCFPHLGRGALSEAGRACIDGFDALNRIVSTTRPDSKLVHEFLTGRSDRLLREPLDIDQPHIRHGVERDRRTAARFYRAGPRAMREIRLRHAGKGVVSREQFVYWVTEEVDAIIGPASGQDSRVQERLTGVPPEVVVQPPSTGSWASRPSAVV